MEQERAFKGIWIPKEIWLSKDLTLQEKVFIVEIDSLDNEQGCFASNNYFADFFGITASRASQVINALKEKGYINVSFEKEDRQIIKRILKINRPPYPYLENYIGVKFSKEGIKNPKEGIKNIKGGYLENCEDNNISINNTINNTDNNIIGDKSPKPHYSEAIKEIVDYLNYVCNTNYKHSTKTTCEAIKARLKEGFTVDDFKTVIDKKYNEWGNDPKMVVYLRPQTLFGTKFEGYLNQPITDGRQLSETDKALMRWVSKPKEETQEKKSMLEGDLF